LFVKVAVLEAPNGLLPGTIIIATILFGQRHHKPPITVAARLCVLKAL